MLCSIARELISLYLDRELQPAQATDLRKHVYTCTACQHYQEAMEHAAMLLAEPPLAVPPADFDQSHEAHPRRKEYGWQARGGRSPEREQSCET
jgi:predicted anti-sigma-YlaC factor YlaD